MQPPYTRERSDLTELLVFQVAKKRTQQAVRRVREIPQPKHALACWQHVVRKEARTQVSTFASLAFLSMILTFYVA